MQKISIIEFSVENYKVFKEKVTFSMLSRKNDHSFLKNGNHLLRTSLIYGPNASGKSTLFEAFDLLRSGVVNSANNTIDNKLPYTPHLLSDISTKKPSYSEIIFSLNNEIFRYNFSISRDEINTENLYKSSSSGKEEKCLTRNKQNINLFGDFKKSEDVKAKTRKNVLFLSAASQWNNKLAIKIVEGFNYINILSGPNSDRYQVYTVKLFRDNPGRKEKILEFLRRADFCISDGIIEKTEIPSYIKKEMGKYTKEIPMEADRVTFLHPKFNSVKKEIGFEKINIEDESEGTQKFFAILGPVIDTLEAGRVLFIDEFDNSLHPLLTKFIIDLFENQNPNNAQLIVTTHDTSLLSYKDDYIKDHFWFTEKNKYGAGNLFSLAEFDVDLRNDTEYSKKYLEGKFGALPFIELT